MVTVLARGHEKGVGILGSVFRIGSHSKMKDFKLIEMPPAWAAFLPAEHWPPGGRLGIAAALGNSMHEARLFWTNILALRNFLCEVCYCLARWPCVFSELTCETQGTVPCYVNSWAGPCHSAHGAAQLTQTLPGRRASDRSPRQLPAGSEAFVFAEVLVEEYRLGNCGLGCRWR